MAINEAETEVRALDEERNLLKRAQAADRAAFEELVYKYDQGILRLALRMLGNREEAREAYQETFLKAYRSLHGFRLEASFYTWIYRIATNTCLDRLRKRQLLRQEISMEAGTASDPYRFEPKSSLAFMTPNSNPERSVYGQEIGRRIHEALQTLSNQERLVFEMKHYQGLRLNVISGILGVAEKTVKDYLYRGTQKLRAQLANL